MTILHADAASTAGLISGLEKERAFYINININMLPVSANPKCNAGSYYNYLTNTHPVYMSFFSGKKK